MIWTLHEMTTRQTVKRAYLIDSDARKKQKDTCVSLGMGAPDTYKMQNLPEGGLEKSKRETTRHGVGTLILTTVFFYEYMQLLQTVIS